MSTKTVFVCDRCSAKQDCISGTVCPSAWARFKIDRKDGSLLSYGENIDLCGECYNRFRDWMFT